MKYARFCKRHELSVLSLHCETGQLLRTLDTQHNFSFASPKQLSEKSCMNFSVVKSVIWSDRRRTLIIVCDVYASTEKRSWKFNPFSTEIWFLSMSMDIKLPDFIESYIVYHAAAGVSACHDWKFFQSSKKCMYSICQSASEWIFPRNAIISFRFSSLLLHPSAIRSNIINKIFQKSVESWALSSCGRYIQNITLKKKWENIQM